MHSIIERIDFVGPRLAEPLMPVGPRRVLLAVEAFLAALLVDEAEQALRDEFPEWK
jgi:hypothetical protein